MVMGSGKVRFLLSSPQNDKENGFRYGMVPYLPIYLFLEFGLIHDCFSKEKTDLNFSFYKMFISIDFGRSGNNFCFT
jgi:hypothetical protein